MYTQGTPEYFVDQGLYYSNATNYGYYCTGYESPAEWEDNHRVFNTDGGEFQYTGVQTENSPCVYYTSTHGYAHLPYNQYNPYISGVMIGVDGSYIGAQQYYTINQYQDTVTSPDYIPVAVQTNITSPSSGDPLLDTGLAFANGPDGRSLKHDLTSSSAALLRNPSKTVSNWTNSLTRTSEGSGANAGCSKPSVVRGNVCLDNFPISDSSHGLQSRGSLGQPSDKISIGNAASLHKQLKVTLPASNELSNFGSSLKLQPRIHIGSIINDVNGSPDTLGDQNRGPRTNKSKSHMAVKAYTTKVGESDVQGNIIMCTDHYNKDDFPVDYADAKFFVIKSYSEDDVHKSIKYNVWSSTLHGNKKLQSAYNDAQKIAAGRSSVCPIFLFFSVNASGQFCGVAEMIGPVDFHRDMNFWQQDKWSGSFPVKWHIIKDVPNTRFRHIILENNENKPVTNSRDTQEVMHKQGLEMLKIFKGHTLKTSLLEDFMFYENRQKIMQKEKAGLIFNSFETTFPSSVSDTTCKQNCLVQLPINKNEKIMEQNDLNCLKDKEMSASKTILSKNSEQITANLEKDITSGFKIGSLNTNPKKSECSDDCACCAAKSENIVTVGSMPVKVNGFGESSGFVTVGTIPLDPRAFNPEKATWKVND